MFVLKKYQKDNINKLVPILRKYNSSFMFEMVGSGKTLQVVLAMKELGVSHIIAVSPKSLVVSKVWEEEVKKWGLNMRVTAKGYSFVQNIDKVMGLISSLENEPDVILGIVFDEAQAVKTPSTRRKTVKTSKNAMLLKNYIIDRNGYSLALTGTPVTRTQEDLFGILVGTQSTKLLNEVGLGTLTNFRADFCRMIQMTVRGRIISVIDSNNIPRSFSELVCKLKGEFGIIGNVDTSADLMSTLKESVERDIYVEVPEDKGGEMEAKIAFLRERLDIYEGREIPVEDLKEIELSYNTLKRFFGMRKAKLCIEPIKKIASSQGKVIVYCFHKDVANSLKDSLDNSVLITGGSSEKERLIALEKFKNGEATYLVATIQSMNTGLTLTHCNVMVFVELSYTFTETVQAKARINRISQEKVCNYYFITDRDSKYERRLLKILSQKSNLLDLVMGGS